MKLTFPRSLIPSLSSPKVTLKIFATINNTSARRNFRLTPKMSAPPAPPTPTPSFSSNYEPSKGTQDLIPLLKGASEGGTGKWTLIPSGKGIERSFKFKTFKKTWEFMNTIATHCKTQKHHPEWSNVYNTTFIRWTTHSPPGLSEKDVVMARICDEVARECGEVEGEGDGDGGKGRELADRVAMEGGDCCVPKKKKDASS